MTHLLVTNDYPPKVGGIQSYLWELWRRLPPGSAVVLTHRADGSATFDAAAPHRIERLSTPMLLPTPLLVQRIREEARRADASLVLLDPVFPLGLVGPRLGLPYGVVLHGAELVVPAKLPIVASSITRTLAGARLVIAAGRYVAREARHLVGAALPEPVVVPPGVDLERFCPLSPSEVAASRRRFGLQSGGRLVVGVSRLVPRKGMDVLIEAAARLSSEYGDLVVAIGGAGRDAHRLEALARRLKAPVRLIGSVPDEELPLLVGAADVFAMLCRNRWGGLEQEGFGVVFLEAAAAGVPALAGRSGGADEAVTDGETGLVVARPADVTVVASALRRLLDDAGLRHQMGTAAHARAEREFDYSVLARRLEAVLVEAGG